MKSFNSGKKRAGILLLATILISGTLVGCGNKLSATKPENIQSPAIDSTSEQTEWKDLLNVNANSGKYTLLFINDAKAENSEELEKSMRTLAEKTSDQFSFVEVEYAKSEKSLLEYLNVPMLNQLPMALSIAPSGLICAGFDKECTEEELKATITTGNMEKILLALQKGEITLITVHNGNSDISDLDKTISKEAEPYNGCVVNYFLNRTNEEDAKFISNFPETKGEVTLIVTVPPGSIVTMLSDDELTPENIAAAIKQASEGGGCGC